MFRHVVMWKFADDCDPGYNRETAIKIKASVEELKYLCHGVHKVVAHIDPVGESENGADIFVECEFESRVAFEAYRNHPNRLAAAELLEDCGYRQLNMEFESRIELE